MLTSINNGGWNMVYVNWTPKLRRYIVRQVQMGFVSVSEIARNRRVPRRTVHCLLEKFKTGGFEALEPRMKGRRKEVLNQNLIQIVVDEWKGYKIGSHKMWRRLKNKGFSVSQRKIQEIYNQQGFRLSRRSRPKQIKFVKYERQNPNELWHTDWTTDPATGQQMIAFIDDCTRVLIHAEIFAQATAENTLLAFQNAITHRGKPEAILTDNGTQFTPAKGEKGLFTQWCEKQGIRHILGRIHHPQTNGKIERWFGTYKQEYDERFNCLKDFIKYYNEERTHQGIGYQTPQEKWQKHQTVQN